jgi:hypothetical protein
MAGPYQQYPPEAPAGARELPKGLSTTAMVLGIVGLVFSALGCTWFLGLPCDILAIIFGAVAISKTKSGEQGGEGMAKAGLICGIIGFVVVIAWFVILFIWGAYLAQYAPYYYYQ